MTTAAAEDPTVTGGASGLGLATFAGDTILEVWYPAPALGTTPTDVPNLDAGIDSDTARDVSVRSIVTLVDDLQAPPADTADAYLRLHLLSHRLVKPRTINLDGIFGVLPIVAWTNIGAVAVDRVTATRLHLRRKGQHLTVHGVDRFPRMVDYVVPSGVRIADADRVRLGAYLAPGTVVMHEGFVNFNAGTLGTSMVEGRISAGVVVDEGSDIGGGASIMGTLSGGGTEQISIGRGSLIGANAGVGAQPRRQLHRRGGPLRHRGLQGPAAGRLRREGAGGVRAGRSPVPPQLPDGRDRGRAAHRHVGRPELRPARRRLTPRAVTTRERSLRG